ncbi:MAG: type 4a pilus biogenesis protein PilO [Polaromonas sp.]|uniref:type 4a pilus biogenesis protein PilO n=1 Tax=Polaromonas sp. TaxID=1869339 RepID=UPI002730CD20|nr:type 4a pilus biogenesis protein PilO [Polaromonas sp.]MDP1741910.1 type 4a pilus biogenesis protein PilO [Polaromonas sp.]MDP1954351.1 type 4a pilus biogenesis protein PilO [Polaromonas sp.]MDP3357363.1 type 4a pilus biogenesis protein PilO [Polaromonas sp.]MDP3751251.1 type 4a pilus biogenesis protein PilO [Polaromonas sp.]
MASIATFKPDFPALLQALKGQFVGLNPNDPPSWPAFPRYVLCMCVTAVVVVALWFVWLSSSDDELKAEQAKELQLREDYKKKLTQAVSLDALKKQREQVQQYVTQLEKQLPSKAEMDALLSDINQAGLGRSLQFELFRPGQVSVREYYAELPISIKVTGRYHDMGAFAADIANLSRIVTLNNISIAPVKDGSMSMETTAKTFRYLDPEEVILQRKTTAPGKEAKK